MDRTYRYELRPAERARDLSRMVEIERACFPEDLAYLRGELYRFLRAKNAQTVLAVDRESGRTAGFVIVSWRSGCRVGYVQTLDVDPSEQGNGLGRLLLETAERIMAERGLERSILQVYLRNNAALVLYLKSGYTIRRVRSRYYKNAYRGARDAIEMVRALEPLPPTRLTVPEPAPTPLAPAVLIERPAPAAAVAAAEGVAGAPITLPPGLDTPLPPAPAVHVAGTGAPAP
ncbi:MAG TPA: GNAT family N-acetyltransferase [Candidatus Thermoplasmatota archaeon]